MSKENLDEMKKLISEIVSESYSIGNLTTDDLKFGRYLCGKDVESLKTVQENSVELQKMIENINENILPCPVIRDDNGKIIKDYSPCDFYLKLQEEIFEVMESEMKFHYAEFLAVELADIITVCISYLNALGYDENKRSEIFAKVNEKNEKRGYFRNA